MFNPLRGVVLATVHGSITPNIGGSITAVSDSYGNVEDVIYKAALKIAIQARIQMYLKAWENAARLYQELNSWVTENLPELHALRGASLNNQGVALGMGGKLDDAIQCFEAAKTELDLVVTSTISEVRSYFDLLENLISIMEYAEQFDAARPHYQVDLTRFHGRYELLY